jgi:hypothetical protein
MNFDVVHLAQEFVQWLWTFPTKQTCFLYRLAKALGVIKP